MDKTTKTGKRSKVTCFLLVAVMCMSFFGCAKSNEGDSSTAKNSQDSKNGTGSLTYEQRKREKEEKIIRIAQNAYNEDAQNFSYTNEQGESDTLTIYGIHELTADEKSSLGFGDSNSEMVLLILDKVIGYQDEESNYYETPDLKYVIIGFDSANGFALNTEYHYIIDIKNPDAPVYDYCSHWNTLEWLHEPIYYIDYSWAVANGYAEKKSHYSVSPKSEITESPNITTS